LATVAEVSLLWTVPALMAVVAGLLVLQQLRQLDDAAEQLTAELRRHGEVAVAVSLARRSYGDARTAARARRQS